MTTRAEADRAGFAVAPGVLLAGIAGGLAFPILPAVGLERGLPAFVIGAILAANRLSRIVAGPFVGALADRSGARRKASSASRTVSVTPSFLPPPARRLRSRRPPRLPAAR